MILRDERCNDDFVTFCPYFTRWLHSNLRYPCNDDTRKRRTLMWQIITAKVIYTLYIRWCEDFVLDIARDVLYAYPSLHWRYCSEIWISHVYTGILHTLQSVQIKKIMQDLRCTKLIINYSRIAYNCMFKWL